MQTTNSKKPTRASSSSEKKPQRSRSGCARCRYHRKKCDETKPQCSRCVRTGNACHYDLQLRWGGRSFAKSFGKYGEKVDRLGTVVDGFVYGLPGTGESKIPEKRGVVTTSATTEAATEATAGTAGTETVTTRTTPAQQKRKEASSNEKYNCDEPPAVPSPSVISLESWPSLLSSEAPRIYRFLFHYYVHETTRLTAPSSYARLHICRGLVPLSLQRPSLLFAMMASAAQHLKFIGHVGSGMDSDMDQLISSVTSQSIYLLQARWQQQKASMRSVTEDDAALATACTLHQAEIMFGDDSWRAHLVRARNIMESAHVAASSTPTFSDFLSSWYHNAEALASVSPLGFRGSKLGDEDSPDGCGSQVHFDLFGGVASDLPDLFRQVGALLEECRRQDELDANNCSDLDRGSPLLLSRDDILAEAEELSRTIHARLERDKVENLGLGDGSRFSLTSDDVRDYALSNACFLHTALLYLYGFVRRLSPTAPEVQRSVQFILWCASNMQLASVVSPRVLMVTPLFAAGIWGTKSDRLNSKAVVEELARSITTHNAAQAVSILDSLCQLPDAHGLDAWSYLKRQNPGYMPY